MSKKLQVQISDEAWNCVEALRTSANQDFEFGSINFSDTIDEMILSAKVDLRSFQAKHTDLTKSLKSLAARKDIDLNSAIKVLMDLKTMTGKRKSFTAEDAIC